MCLGWGKMLFALFIEISSDQIDTILKGLSAEKFLCCV